ncbi:MAG: hypothetical protein AB1547_03275 [Thermodesulfobacteriota bacterium]
MNPWHPVETEGTPQNASVRRIPLDLRHHCIQTALKRLFEYHMNRYFTDPDMRKDLEPLLDVLGDILASWDFAVLRAFYQDLAGGHEVSACLVLPENAAPFLELSGKRIDPPSRNLTGSVLPPRS